MLELSCLKDENEKVISSLYKMNSINNEGGYALLIDYMKNNQTTELQFLGVNMKIEILYSLYKQISTYIETFQFKKSSI